MRTKPIGTGPFKFVEFKRNESIKLVRNPDYWKKGKPYLDAIEMAHHRQPLDAHPGLRRRRVRHDVRHRHHRAADEGHGQRRRRRPSASCGPTNVSTNLIVNREPPPFNNPKIRKAMALALDRKAFIDILTEGKANIGGAMLPAPEGNWGMPPEDIAKLPGYGADIEKNRAEARKIMEGLGYGPAKPLKVKVSTRNIADLSRSRR